jgi:DinB superfamily
MNYTKEQAIEILERTPAVLTTLLSGISNEWVMNNEGPETFSPYDVVGHLIHGEKTDWVVRAKLILEYGTEKPFEPYDRFAQYDESKGKSLQQLLDEFDEKRKQNIVWLQACQWTEADLERKGLHPVLGEVTLRNLMSTWVVHDLTHIAQVTRVMAKQLTGEMGPWPQFFRILSF